MSSKKKPVLVAEFEAEAFNEIGNHIPPSFYCGELGILLCRIMLDRVIDIPKNTRRLFVSIYKSQVRGNYVIPGGIRVWNNNSIGEIGVHYRRIGTLFDSPLFVQTIAVDTDIVDKLGFHYRKSKPTMRNAWAAYSSLEDYSTRDYNQGIPKKQVKLEYLETEVPCFAKKLWFAVEYE